MGQQEVSVEVDFKDLEKLLTKIHTRIRSAFGKQGITKLMERWHPLPIGGRDEVTFSVKPGTAAQPLRIVLYKEDFDTVGLFLFARAQIARPIDEAVRNFLLENNY